MGDTLPTGQLSNIPWRRAGVKYTNNEAYFDVIEEIDAIIDKSGKVPCKLTFVSQMCLHVANDVLERLQSNLIFFFAYVLYTCIYILGRNIPFKIMSLNVFLQFLLKQQHALGHFKNIHRKYVFCFYIDYLITGVNGKKS